MKPYPFFVTLLISMLALACEKEQTTTSIYERYNNSSLQKIGYTTQKHNLNDLEFILLIQNHYLSADSVPKAPIGSFSMTANGYDIAKKYAAMQNGDFSIDSLLLASLYGSNIELKVKEQSILADGNVGIKEHQFSMYVPSLIKITNPKIELDDVSFPQLSPGFKLQWNADDNNPNGVMLSIAWAGDDEQYIEHTCIAPDNGEIILDEDLFENIPNNEIVWLTILRANKKPLDLESYSYLLVAETKAIINVYLEK